MIQIGLPLPLPWLLPVALLPMPLLLHLPFPLLLPLRLMPLLLLVPLLLPFLPQHAVQGLPARGCDQAQRPLLDERQEALQGPGRV